jgi:hypothetical protein
MRDAGHITKYVAWGSGRFFRIVRGLTDIPFAYVVDNNPARWGETVEGLTIKGPQDLAAEDPSATAVVICSYAHPAIKEQIMRLGEFKILVALNDIIYEDIRAYLAACRREARPKPPASSDAAIVIQGPHYAELTSLVLRHFALNYPETLIILSTWAGTPQAALDDAQPFVDEIVLSQPPAFGGLGNRNHQIVSSRAGARRAVELGARRTLKTRSDAFLLAKGLFHQLEALRRNYDDSRCRELGLGGRLAVLDNCSNKFLPYSVSDLILYGDAADVLAFWDCPLDDRELIWDNTRSLDELSRDMIFPETWFARHFAKRIGWDAVGTLHDSFAFFRDLFLVLDTEWAGFFMEKYPYPQRWASAEELRSRMTHYFWQGLYFDNPVLWREADLFDIEHTSWMDTFKKIHPGGAA